MGNRLKPIGCRSHNLNIFRCFKKVQQGFQDMGVIVYKQDRDHLSSSYWGKLLISLRCGQIKLSASD
jgi:hypothetical protein